MTNEWLGRAYTFYANPMISAFVRKMFASRVSSPCWWSAGRGNVNKYAPRVVWLCYIMCSGLPTKCIWITGKV